MTNDQISKLLANLREKTVDIPNLKKVLIFDVETTTIDILHRTYDLRVSTKRYQPDQIQRDWTLLGAAWKWLGSPKINVISVNPDRPLDDDVVTYNLYKAVEEADILIGHNLDSFDIKKLNTRAVMLGLPPLAPKQSIDTLKIARKYFKFTSNKLGFVAKCLGVEDKGGSPDWGKCIDGDEKELRYMRKYNKQDVIVTEQVYLKMMGWHHTHPNLIVHAPVKDIKGKPVTACPKCHSANFQARGARFTNTGKKQQYCCKNCGGWWSERKQMK